VASKNYFMGDLQVEVSTVASAFETRPYALELSMCQRYYEPDVPVFARGTSPGIAGTFYLETPAYFKAPKRVAPTLIAGGSITTNNVASETATNITTAGFRYSLVLGSSLNTDSYVIGRLYAASARL
jgi:hypothetical protein